MAASITLEHTIRKSDSTFFYYDGELPVKNGRVTVPTDRPDVIKRAWTLGYRLYRGKELATWPEVEAKISA